MSQLGRVRSTQSPHARGLTPALERIAQALKPFETVKLAYVFGSFLEREDFRDIDLGLVLAGDPGPEESLARAMEVGRSVERAIEPRREVDVKVLNTAPLSAQYEVVRTGLCVFARDEGERVRYEADLTSEWLDYKPTSDWLDEQFLQPSDGGNKL